MSLALWTLFGAVQVALYELADFSSRSMRDADTPAWFVALVLSAGWSWAACTPLVFWLTRRLAPSRVGLARAVAGHAGAWLVLSAVNTLVRAGVQHLLAPEVPRLEVIYVYNLDANLIAYLTLVGVGHALALRDEYTRRAARTLALRAEVAQARLQFLQRQLRPHFLFNALNAVAELAREAPAAAERTLECLARLLRSAVAHEGEPEVPLREELATLAPFVEVQRIRFGSALAVSFDVPAAARDALVPSLALQPLVENAVRHGLSATNGRGRVHVAARLAGDRLVVSVRDNGRPRDDATPGDTGGGSGAFAVLSGRPGVGLSNMRSRLAQLYGADQALTLAPAPGGGTVATFDIPLRHAGDPLPLAAEPRRPPGGHDEAWWRRLRAGLARRRAAAPADVATAASTPASTPVSTPASAATPAPSAEEMARSFSTTGAWLAPDALVDPPLTWHVVAAFAAVWAGAGVFWMLQGQLFDWLLYGRLDAWRMHLPDFVSALLWAGLTPLVLTLARTWRIGRDGWLGPLALHLVAALVVDVVHIATIVRLALPGRSLLHPANIVQLTLNVLIYCALIAWSHGRDFAAWYRERELVAARLEAALAHARWRSLALAVRPPFLLAVLARASALVRVDAARAERVIERLADVLRATLDGTTRPGTATVGEELAVLGASLALYHETAAAPAHLAAQVEPAALDEPAPGALFRTLVEAVTSLEERATPGRSGPPVRIAVRTEGERLATVLVVETIPPLFGTPVPGARHPDASTAVMPLPVTTTRPAASRRAEAAPREPVPAGVGLLGAVTRP
ncbi:MAG TPA: histidine kinase [Gemmatirosa sp.]|nr:histidine kinase [Gemmatirosa sp.]